MKAVKKPTKAAIFCAGISIGSRPLRHNWLANQAPSPASIVTCNPEIEIKCPMPVVLKIFQSSSEILF